LTPVKVAVAPPTKLALISNAQSGLAKATATRAPLDGEPVSGCQALVPAFGR